MPDFTKLLEIAGPKALGLFIACVLIKLANAHGLISLADIHSSAAAVNDVALIVSGALTSVWIAELLVHRAQAAIAHRRYRATVRGYLSTLSVDERDLFDMMVLGNQQSVTRPLDDLVVAGLRQKGLLRQAGGVGHLSAWTFTVPPDAWREIQAYWRDKRES
jgi:hypothetical protein